MNLYDIIVKDGNKNDLKLSDLKGKIILVVNTATGCGFTPQYEGLEYLYQNYHDKGLEILDFPCNQFGNQAPGSNEEIKNFCQMKYNTSFNQLDKTDVNGDNESPIFTYLKEKQKEDIIKGTKNKMAMKAVEKISKTYQQKEDIKWNFTKFLIDKEGNVIKRYSPTYDPKDIEEDIKKLL